MTTEASWVRAPASYCTAVLENEPATGIPDVNAAAMFASPSPLSSAFDSSLYRSLAATAFATETDSTNPTSATASAAGNNPRTVSSPSGGTEIPGSPLGTSPTIPTPAPWRPKAYTAAVVAAATTSAPATFGKNLARHASTAMLPAPIASVGRLAWPTRPARAESMPMVDLSSPAGMPSRAAAWLREITTAEA